MLDGLAGTRSPGRMELVWDRPRILVDGAHNPVALSALMRCVGAHVPYDSMVCIFGCCEDKDIAGLLSKAALGGDKIIFTRAKGNPRAMDPEELQRRFVEHSGKMSQVARTLPEALDLAPFASAAALEELGLDRLKAAALAAGLKCGGTLEQRAARLWATKGKPRAEWDKSLLAK